VRALNQGERQPLAVEDQVLQVFAATNGFIDRIEVDRVPAFLADLVSTAHARHKELREKVAGGDWSDETQAALRAAVSEFAEDFGYDLDEEGQPLDDDAPPPPAPPQQRSAAPAGDQDAAQPPEDQEPPADADREPEAATA